MKKMLVLTLTLLFILTSAALAATTQDRAGEPINLPEQIEKIVSMAPSTTRVLTDLGLTDKLIAVDTFSAYYQPELAELPQFDTMTPDAEQLAQLEPDDCNTEENVAWLNELGDGEYVQVAEFLSDFHSPVEGGGSWEADTEYTDWQWWLARKEGGGWDLLTWGY